MSKDYGRLVKRAALCATLVASSLLIIKIVAWWITGSVSLLASVVDSLVDIAASATNLVVLSYALQPADKHHTFGHGKAESLAALAQGMFISGSAIFLLLTGAQHLAHPEPLGAPGLGIIVMVISLIMTIALVFFQHWVVKKTRSQAIHADMLHYKSDILMNTAVLLALLLSWYGFSRADAVFAILIGLYILYSAWHIGHSAIQSLLDRALPDSEREDIIRIIKSQPSVLGAHDLRTRQSGPVRFIQFHIELADELPLADAHEITEQVEQALLAHFPHAEVFVHQDPSSVVAASHQGHWEL